MAGLMGCTTYRYTEYGAKEPEKFYGTQPGYHGLSAYFSVDVSDYLMRFYFLGASTTEKQKIGILKVRWYDRSDYGPRQMAYAISDDGKRLLFFDEPGAEQGKPLRTKDRVVVADLYFFDADRGQSELLQRDVHRRGIGCVEFPRNYLPYGVVHSIANIALFAYSTERQQISVEARRRNRQCGRL
jgi:hypothetical protein